MKPFMTLLFAALAICASAQKKNAEELYLWDARFKPVTNVEAASFFTSVMKINDTCWQWDTYNLNGPMVSSEQYKDHGGKQLHGEFFQYQRNGFVDSTGMMKDGLPEGDWYFCNDTGAYVMQKKFDKGKIIFTKDLLKERNEKKSDTAEVEKDEKESEFTGGVRAWMRYLNKNFRYPDRAIKMNKQGTVVLQFIVDKDGNVSDVDLFRSIEYSLDREALRIIRDSPKWTPATQEGRLVKSYKKQPITFRLQ